MQSGKASGSLPLIQEKEILNCKTCILPSNQYILDFSFLLTICLPHIWLRQEPNESLCSSVCLSFHDKVEILHLLSSNQSSNQSGISQQSVSTQRALRERESTHRALSEESVSTQSIKIRVRAYTASY